MQQDKVITDLRCALPANGWTDTGCHAHDTRPQRASEGRWQVLDYRSEYYSGSLLMTVSSDAAVLTIPLNRKGWHAVSIGMANPWMRQAVVEVRLSGEKAWHVIEGYVPTELYADGRTIGHDTKACLLHEEPWIFADLTDQDLEVRYPRGHMAIKQSGYCSICSIRTVPMRPEDIPVVSTRRHRRCVHFNGDLFEYNARFDNDQWDVVCANNSVCADITSYPSDVCARLDIPALLELDRMPPHLEKRMKILEDMERRGEHPLRAAIARAHKHDKRFWLASRPQMWAGLPYAYLLRSPFFSAHPEYRCLEANGDPTSKLSIAFPDVRSQLQAPLQEALAWGADGITILLNRGYPLVRYEEPVRQRFWERYGQDVREVPEYDERLLGVWTDFVTEWMRELRKMLDDAGPSPMASRRELTVFTGPSPEWDRQFGIDVELWAQEGLVDVVLPYPRHTHTAFLYARGYERPDGWVDVARYAAALEGSRTELIPSMGSYDEHGAPLALWRERANDFYRQGATGVCRWDDDLSLAFARMDDPEIQRLWHLHYRPPQNNLMVELGGLNMAVFPPGIGG